ncbi:MAG: hypothetical protein K6E57_08575 [Fibrobacter sp.]|nr:hypothetical protein [Fibrobacter sp.]
MMKEMKILAFGIVALTMSLFVACSTDGDPVIVAPNGEIYSQEEYAEFEEKGELDEKGNVIVTDSTAKSSSSKKASSSSTKGSSSSDKATSSSSSEKASSSSEKADSSSDEAKSSSSAKVDSSSSAPESSSEAGKVTIINEEEGIFTIGTDDMTVISESDQSELDSLKQILDEGGSVDGFELADSEFNEETLLYEDFDENDFFCFTGEGEWLKITREQLGKHIPHYKNGQAWGNFRQFDVKFMEACAAVYIRRK